MALFLFFVLFVSDTFSSSKPPPNLTSSLGGGDGQPGEAGGQQQQLGPGVGRWQDPRCAQDGRLHICM